MSATVAETRALVPGDRIRMPCNPDAWETVISVRDLGDEDRPCFKIECGNHGHGGEIPLEIRKAATT